MAKKKKSPTIETALPSLPPGVKLLRTFEGHQNAVRSVAFNPSGGMLASGSNDNTVKLWEATSGKLIRILEGHTGEVRGVAFDPLGGTLASGGHDGTAKLWEVTSGKLIRALEGHMGEVWGVAFDPLGATLACGGHDGTVKLWEVTSGKLTRTLEGHENYVNSVAFDPSGGTLASGGSDGTVKLWDGTSGKLIRTFEGHANSVYSVVFDLSGTMLATAGEDNTVKLWEATSGKLLRTLEGHMGTVDIVAFSLDGQLLASKSNDDTIRLWNRTTWETVAVISVPKIHYEWIPSLAFHPTLPLLATSGSPPDTQEEEELCRQIHLYELDYDVLLGSDTGAKSATTSTGRVGNEKTVHSTTAKIVLVGDSGVGKTGLGWRLAHGEYREHDSTHGQQFWVLDQLAATRKDGTLCEAVLWDLAGQPDYRLIHALSIQDADLALILFDPTNSRDPLGSAEYWLRQLPAECPKILVAARVDRGHPVLSDDELAAFCKRQGIAGGWIATSARENLGLDELLARMKQAIPWDDKPVVSTDAVFKRIKDFVLALKESRTRKQVIFTATELLIAITKQLKRRVWTEEIHSVFTAIGEESIFAAIRNLSSQGFVRMLTLSSGEERILLVPELMNNLAASMVLEARRNPRGLGAVEESRLFDNSYSFRELEKLSKQDRELLLDGTIEAFLSNRLSYRCFREHAGEIKLLIFPDLMNLKKPQRDDLITENGASYILSGATENTFSGLVVLLGYTNLFARTDQAHDVAWFESDRKEICGVRQIRDENERTIVLLFSRDASVNIRQVFEGLVEQMLSCRDTHVRRVRPVKCSRCGTPVDRAVMARLLKQGKSAVGCENADCLHRVDLPPDEPLSVKPAQRQQIVQEGAVAELRTRFEEVIFELSRLAQTERFAAPTCFVSYAWGNPDHERWVENRLAMDLEKAGIKVILDRWENPPGADIQRFVDRIEKADRVLIVGTKAYRRKYENKDPSTGTVVALEMKIVWARLTGPAHGHPAVIPLLLEGDFKESLPPVLHAQAFSDFRNDERYFDIALELLIGLYSISPRHKAVSHWKKQLARDGFGRYSSSIPLDDEDLPTDEEMKQALKRVGSRALNSAFDSNQPAVVEQHGQLVWLYSDGTTKPYIASEAPESYRES